MRTTVKLMQGRDVVISPADADGGITVQLCMFGAVVVTMPITPDQAGAMLFGIEQALEFAEIKLKAAS